MLLLAGSRLRGSCVSFASPQGIRKQAYELRFILEAPELEISAEERVQIPVGQELVEYRSVP